MRLILTKPDPVRRAKIESILPKIPLTEELIPILLKTTKKYLITALKQEIEIYKAFPKDGRMLTATFDPRNHKTCFMGQAFDVTNSNVENGDLIEYRKAVGTYRHGTWGNATLLEIWAGDHFKDHKKMVSGVFAYCKGERATCPPVKFEVLPLFSNTKSGRWIKDDDDKEKYFDEWVTAMNGELANYKLKPLKIPLEEKWQKAFDKSWENEKSSIL